MGGNKDKQKGYSTRKNLSRTEPFLEEGRGGDSPTTGAASPQPEDTHNISKLLGELNTKMTLLQNKVTTIENNQTNQITKKDIENIEANLIKNLDELALQVNNDSNSAIRQIEQNTNLFCENITAMMETLKGPPMEALGIILQSDTSQALIKATIKTALTDQMKEMHEKNSVIAGLITRIKKLENSPANPIPSTTSKITSATAGRLEKEAALRKKIISAHADFDKRKLHSAISAISPQSSPFIRFINNKKACLTFDSYHGAQSFQRDFIQAHKENKLNIFDSPTDSKKIRISDSIPASLAASNFSMVGLGSHLRKANIIKNYNINLGYYGLKLSVLGRNANTPEGANEWFTSIKEFPTIEDFKDLYLGPHDPHGYTKLTKKDYLEFLEKCEQEKKMKNKDAPRVATDKMPKRKQDQMSSPHKELPTVKRSNTGEGTGEGMEEGETPEDNSLNTNSSVASADFSLDLSPVRDVTVV